MAGLIILTVVVIIFVAINNWRNRPELQLAEHKKIAENFIRDFAAKKLPPVRSSLILKPGERAYFSETNVNLYETRAYSIGVGVGTRIGKIFLGSHKSESRDGLKKVDEGWLTITNRRLVFSGRMQQRTLLINEIEDIVSHLDYFSISSEKRDKKLLFQVENPTLWQVLIRNSANGNMEKVLREGVTD